MNRERFNKQLSFILEADKEKNILRQTHLTGYSRRENDAEREPYTFLKRALYYSYQ